MIKMMRFDDKNDRASINEKPSKQHHSETCNAVNTRVCKTHQTSTVQAPDKNSSFPAGTLLPITYYLLPITVNTKKRE